MPMPQYNSPMYAQGTAAVGPYNLQGYQQTFGYNPQQTYLPQTQQPQMATQQPQTPSLVGRIVTANDQIPPAEIPSNGTPAYFPLQDGSAILVKDWGGDMDSDGGTLQHGDMTTMTPDEQLNHLKMDVETMWRDATPEQRKRIKESLTKWSTTLTV